MPLAETALYFTADDRILFRRITENQGSPQWYKNNAKLNKT